MKKTMVVIVKSREGGKRKKKSKMMRKKKLGRQTFSFNSMQYRIRKVVLFPIDLPMLYLHDLNQYHL